MKKHYLVYKITNTKTHKFYIGAHETYNVDDGYMGSGVYLKRAQTKYGIEFFEKEILVECDTREEMYQKEQELVQLHEMSYNIMVGGHGGWEYARSKITPETYEKVRATMLTEEYRERTAVYRDASSKRAIERNKDTIVRQKQIESLKHTMNDPVWIKEVGEKRSAAISTTVKELHASGVYKERDKKLAESRKGLKRATLNGKKIWVKENDPRIKEVGFSYGW